MATIEGTLGAAGRQYGDALNQMGMVPAMVLQSFAKLLEDIEDRKMRREEMAQRESQFSRNLAEMVNERTQRQREAEATRTFQAGEAERGRAFAGVESENETGGRVTDQRPLRCPNSRRLRHPPRKVPHIRILGTRSFCYPSPRWRPPLRCWQVGRTHDCLQAGFCLVTTIASCLGRLPLSPVDHGKPAGPARPTPLE